MGKHDKKKPEGTINPETRFSWQSMPDEFYKARISTLEKENARLREELTEKGRSIGVYEAAIDHQEVVQNGINAEYKELLEEKDDEIEVLKGKIKMLEAAIVKGALREVLA